jgi:hypothetical protein
VPGQVILRSCQGKINLAVLAEPFQREWANFVNENKKIRAIRLFAKFALRI